uniref:Uncharacterized protein n=1 Tax=Rhizophora mucronata TaxID=61149 RepID=A0A2P2KLU1_RHIMU
MLKASTRVASGSLDSREVLDRVDSRCPKVEVHAFRRSRSATSSEKSQLPSVPR